MEIKEVIDCLTNGVGEKPYFRKTKCGDVHVFIADEQLFCIVPGYEDNNEYPARVAEAVCEAGQLLQKAERRKSKTCEGDKDMRRDIESGLKRAY